MGKARKRFRIGSAGIGGAAASLLIFAQAGAAHAPVMAGSAAVPLAVASSAQTVAADSAPERRFSSAPFEKLTPRVAAAAPRLTPSLGEGTYAALELGPLRYADGALDLPGRSRPKPPPKSEIDPTEVGHGVSVPTAIRLPRPFEVGAENSDAGSPAAGGRAFAGGLPLVSSAHASNGTVKAGDFTVGMGGPMSRLPIEGHIVFEKGNAALTRAAQIRLDKLLERVRASHSALEVVAYGGRKGGTSSEARRLSLRRALAVRAYLVSRGIDQTRISVRPLAGVRDDGPKARADVFYASY